MRNFFGILVTSTALLISTAVAQSRPEPITWLQQTTEVVNAQLTKAAEANTPGRNPRSVNPNGSVRLVGYKDWTTGFFPGSLWYGYELTGNKKRALQAKRYTLALDSARYITDTHDVGFMLYCSYGNAFRITHDKTYMPVLGEGAQHLNARFSPKVGVIRSWDFVQWHYPVIIDNMMNLEYLYWAAGEFKKPAYAEAATTHAKTTLKNHFRKDYSSYHVVDYDPETGHVLAKRTHQGITDESAWARGQAWALYGFTMCYKNTKDPVFLAQAEHIADFIMHHPRMPKDKIPVWDFDVHNALDVSEKAPRDASAAAIIASALINLSTQVKDGQSYFEYAEQILKTLSSDEYLAKPGENGLYLLKNSVAAMRYHSDIDTPIDSDDYYYL